MRCYGSTNTHTAPPAPQRSKVTEGAGQRSNTQRTSIMYRSIRNSHIQAQYLTTTKLKSSNSRGCPGEMCEFRIDRFNEPNWNLGKLNSRRLLASGLIYDASGGPGSAVHAHGLLAASHMACLRPMPLLCVLSAAPPSHSLSGKSIVLAMSLITYSRSMSTVCVTTMFCRMFCLARGWPTVRRCLSPEFTLFPTEARPAESCFALSVSFVSQWDSSSSVLARTSCFGIWSSTWCKPAWNVPTNAMHPCCFARLAVKIIDEMGSLGRIRGGCRVGRMGVRGFSLSERVVLA